MAPAPLPSQDRAPGAPKKAQLRATRQPKPKTPGNRAISQAMPLRMAPRGLGGPDFQGRPQDSHRGAFRQTQGQRPRGSKAQSQIAHGLRHL
jgi:hypothetical protein